MPRANQERDFAIEEWTHDGVRRRGTRPRPSSRDGSSRLGTERMPGLTRSGVQIAGAVMHAETALQGASNAKRHL